MLARWEGRLPGDRRCAKGAARTLCWQWPGGPVPPVPRSNLSPPAMRVPPSLSLTSSAVTPAIENSARHHRMPSRPLASSPSPPPPPSPSPPPPPSPMPLTGSVRMCTPPLERSTLARCHRSSARSAFA
eukprot:113710-Prymnesium_polylepis.1